MSIARIIELDEEREYPFIHGGLDKILQLIEDTLNVTLTIRGNKLIIHGEDDIDIERTEQIIEEIRAVNREGYIVKPEDIMHSIQGIKEGKPVSVLGLFQGGIPLPSKKRVIIPKTETQKEYMEAMFKYDIVFGIGPAGTGKTYLAMAMAIHFLLTRQVSRIVLVRPAVEAGERLGFLPGAIEEKVSPYLRPLYDALYDMLDFDRASKLIEKGAIEIAPLAFMRGRTLNDAFIILDEAQNTTTEQMKMYLTRLGFGSKTVITGDITQIDLPSQKVSGLVEALKILKDIEGIKTIYFTDRDVVRHRLVQKIIKAYEKHERQSTA
ncbi:MAG TPA: PhoH family protein [Thermodesulfovibrio thiophilus]|nr:PhoH family protein [Thermodesulfovibrio thiophilus]